MQNARSAFPLIFLRKYVMLCNVFELSETGTESLAFEVHLTLVHLYLYTSLNLIKYDRDKNGLQIAWL